MFTFKKCELGVCQKPGSTKQRNGNYQSSNLKSLVDIWSFYRAARLNNLSRPKKGE